MLYSFLASCPLESTTKQLAVIILIFLGCIKNSRDLLLHNIFLVVDTQHKIAENLNCNLLF